MKATLRLAYIVALYLTVLAAIGCGGGGEKKKDDCCDKDDCQPAPHREPDRGRDPDRGPRPHSHQYGERDAGKNHTVHAGDVVRIKLGEGWKLVGRGIPHLILEDTERGGVHRFRCAAPGSCRLRFESGRSDLEFSFFVRP